MNLTYLKILGRNVKRYRMPYLISLMGLFFSICIFLLIGRYVGYHFSVDGFHENADQIYRLNTLIALPNQEAKYAATSFMVGPDLKEMVPDISIMSRLRSMPTTVTYSGSNFDEGLMTFVDSSFLQLFSFPLTEGDRERCLGSSDGIVITEELATKYFGEASPLGALLTVNLGQELRALKITGVIENPPQNSTINFDMLANISLIAPSFRPGYASILPGLFTYFKIVPGSEGKVLANQLYFFQQERVPEDLQSIMSFQAIPLQEAYFLNDFQFDLARKGNRKILYSLFLLAVLTMVIASINYVNISTALEVKRAKESAVKRVLGASFQQIISANLVEIFVLVSAAAMLAMASFYLLKDRVDYWLGIEDIEDWMSLPQTSMMMAILIVGLTVLCGWYPVFILTRIQVTDILRKQTKIFYRHFDLKKVLLGFQFSISIFFLLVATGIYRQLKYIQFKDPGFNRENILLVDIAGPNIRDKIATLKNTFKEVAGVQSLSASLSPIYGMHTQANFNVPADSTVGGFLSDINYVDADFLETYQTRIIAGRDFSQEISTDISHAFVVNEQAARQLGLDPYHNAVGTEIRKIAQDTMTAKIIGVVADYHSQSLYQKISPLIWQISPTAPNNILAIRIRGDTEHILTDLEQKWSELDIVEDFDYSFLDETMEAAYEPDIQMNLFIRIMTILLLLITAGGLYGMMLFIIEQKRSEIGIRKIIGASVIRIQRHLYGQYFGVLVAGIILGSLAGLYFLDQWLSGFAYQINFDATPVLISGLVGILVAMVTIFMITLKAARLNPVDVLKED